MEVVMEVVVEVVVEVVGARVGGHVAVEAVQAAGREKARTHLGICGGSEAEDDGKLHLLVF